MSNATFKKLTLNGEDHILKMDYNAISELEMYYGKNIFSVVDEEKAGFNTARSIIWAGMLWKNPTLKVHHVGKMLEEALENGEHDLNGLMKISIEALFKSKIFSNMKKKTDEELLEEADSKNE